MSDMSDDQDNAGPSATAKGIAAFIAIVIVLNVVPRVIGLPDVGLPSISFPDLPSWLGTVLHVKNWILGGLLVVVVVCVGLDQLDKHRDGERPEAQERS